MGHRGVALPLLILALALVAVSAAPAYAEKRVALVIGNDRYANLSADKQLLKAAKDAAAVGDALATLGFTVIRGQNLGRQAMIDKLSAFTAQLQPGDTAAVFYAGHGVAIGGVNYLVPSDVPAVTPDAEARVRGNSIAEGDIVGEIQAKGARVALLVIDACRDNPFPRTGTRSIGNTRGLADAKPARGVFTIYSAGIGQTALDRLEKNDPNPNSVFTRIFVQQLGRADRHLVDMVVEVREQVAELALKATDDAGRPVPHEQTPAYYDQTIGGHIYLASRTPPPKPGREPDAKEPAQRDPAGQQVAIAPQFSAMAAPSAPVSRILDDFGFLGTRAVNCDAPPSPTNIVRTTTTSGIDPVKFTNNAGNRGNSYVVTRVNKQTPTMIEIRVKINDQNVMQDITVVKKGNRMRTIRNQKMDGALLVKDGVIVGNGKETPWLEKCK